MFLQQDYQLMVENRLRMAERCRKEEERCHELALVETDSWARDAHLHNMDNFRGQRMKHIAEAEYYEVCGGINV